MHPAQEYIKRMKERLEKVRMLHKYCSVSTAEKILADGTVMLSPPSSFNDPHELKCRVNWPDNDELRRRIDAAHTDLSEKERGNLYQDALRHKCESGDKLPQLTQNLLLNGAGVSCFSETRDNYLMWSHYADKHRGVCIGFSVLGLFLSLSFVGPGGILVIEGGKQCIPFPVQYEDEPPVWEAGLDESIHGVLSTKARCWEYEREWRIFALDSAEKKQNFMTPAFAEVIFGAEIPQNDEVRLGRVIAGGKYPITKPLKAKICEGSYNMEIVDYDWARS